jgi:hypothetical protein
MFDRFTGRIFSTGFPGQKSARASGWVMFLRAARLRVMASTAFLKALSVTSQKFLRRTL